MNFSLRLMTEKDLKITHAWRNDPEVLKHAQGSNPISFKEHEAIFKWNNAIKLIFELDGDPVGFISVSRDPDKMEGEWGFHIGEEYRGQGLSQIMLEATLFYLAKEEAYEKVTSAVKSNNLKSRHLHDKLGFKHIGHKDEYHLYEKEL